MIPSSIISKVRKAAREYNLDILEFGESNRLHKKYQVVFEYKNKIHNIHFGDNRYEDYTTHKDKNRRDNYQKRASGIRNKSGKLTYLDPRYANFWSYHILW